MENKCKVLEHTIEEMVHDEFEKALKEHNACLVDETSFNYAMSDFLGVLSHIEEGIDQFCLGNLLSEESYNYLMEKVTPFYRKQAFMLESENYE